MNRFKHYSQRHTHYYTDVSVPYLLGKYIKKVFSKGDFSIVDLGCGDGSMIYRLKRNGLIHNSTVVYGVDLSSERVRRLKENLPFVRAVVSPVEDVVDIRDEEIDFAISTMVIEHLENDAKFIREVCRILKNNGVFYMTTIYKKWFGWFFYRNNGKWVIDPTHVREYTDVKEFRGMIEKEGFRIEELNLRPIIFYVMDPIVKIFKFPNRVYLQNKFFNVLRKLRYPIPGYYTLEVIATKAL